MEDEKRGAGPKPWGEYNPTVRNSVEQEQGRVQARPEPGQLAESLRFSLGTLLAIADKVKQVEPLRQPKQPEPMPDNILAPEYRRPWWGYLAGLGGLYLGYRLLGKREKQPSG